MRIAAILLLTPVCIFAATPTRIPSPDSVATISDMRLSLRPDTNRPFVKVGNKYDYKWTVGATDFDPSEPWHTISNAFNTNGGYVIQNWDGDVAAAGIVPGGLYTENVFTNLIKRANGKTIKFGAGVYRQDADFDGIPGYDINIRGSDEGETILKHNVRQGVFLRPLAGFTNNIRIENCTFDGEADRTTYWEYVMGWPLGQPPSYEGWRTNTYHRMQTVLSMSFAEDLTAPESVIFRKCRFLNMTETPLRVSDARRVEFCDNYVYKCKDITFINCRDVMLIGNTLLHGHDHGLGITKWDRRAVINDNLIAFQRGCGISISGWTPAEYIGPANIVVSGNIIVGSGWGGMIANAGTSLLNVTGNHVDMAGFHISPDWYDTENVNYMTAGDTTMTVADTNRIALGDWIYVGGENLPESNNYGELTRITGISGNVLTIYPPFRRDLIEGASVWYASVHWYDFINYGGIVVSGNNTPPERNTYAQDVHISGNQITRYAGIGMAIGERTQEFDAVKDVFVTGNTIGPEQVGLLSTYSRGAQAIRLSFRTNITEGLAVHGNKFVFTTNDWAAAYAHLTNVPSKTNISSLKYGITMMGPSTNDEFVIHGNILGKNATAHTFTTSATVATNGFHYIGYDGYTYNERIMNGIVGSLTVTNSRILSGLPSPAGSINQATETMTFLGDEGVSYFTTTLTNSATITNIVADNLPLRGTAVFRNGSAGFTNQIRFVQAGSNMRLPGNQDLVVSGSGTVEFLKNSDTLFTVRDAGSRWDNLNHRMISGGYLTNDSLLVVGDYFVNPSTTPVTITNVSAPYTETLGRMLIRNPTGSGSGSNAMTFVHSANLLCPGASNLVVGDNGVIELIKLGTDQVQVINATALIP